MIELLFEDEVFKIRGAIFEVHKELGNGFLEAVYHECLEYELAKANIPFTSKQSLPISYKGRVINQDYQADIVCFGKIVLELNSCASLQPIHRAQILNYLKATGLPLGLLVNFGTFPKAQIERIAL